MANFRYKLKTATQLNKKPRVYFICHPADFALYFDRLCADIFKTHDCAVFYTEDMNEFISEEERVTDLGRMNLFVVPVTRSLLTTPNRAMDEDIPHAMQEHIPLLPILMQPVPDSLYSRKFGQLQYLNACSVDSSEISYEDKLKKYLDATLISEETVNRIRSAFDAYIFLSYRKKDRRYANELMRLIHSNPECRDIAIWFDEFLIPGESFRDSIDKVLSNSKLFTLLVTPNILEKPDGKPNFVMGEEYPAAKSAGLEIIPAEMAETDRAALADSFRDLPDCIDPRNDALFREKLLESVTRLAIQSNTTPEHNFLIGLAYLEGIDVEIDRPRGIALITEAAESGLFEAMKMLHEMYTDGIGTQVNDQKALYWAKRLVIYAEQENGLTHPMTLVALNNLAYAHEQVGELDESLELFEQVYTLSCKLYGEVHQETLLALNNLAMACKKSGNVQRAIDLQQEAVLRCSRQNYLHPDAIALWDNLASIYGDQGDLRNARNMQEQLYALACRVLGEEHPSTLNTLNNLAVTCSKMGDHQKALELKEQVYTLRCKVQGEEHPRAIIALTNLAITYQNLGETQKALELMEKAYPLRVRILGEMHPDTLDVLHSLALYNSELGNYQKAIALYEKAYASRCAALGKTHEDTLVSLNNLAFNYGKAGNHQKALSLHQKAYALRCEAFGETHLHTLDSLCNMAFANQERGYFSTALEQYEKACRLYSQLQGKAHSNTLMSLRMLGDCAVTCFKKNEFLAAWRGFEKKYGLCCELLGEDDPDTLITICNLAATHDRLGNPETASQLYEQAYQARRRTLGEEHEETISTLNLLATACRDMKDYQKELPLREQAYALHCKTFGETHPKTMTALHNLALAHDNSGNSAKAIELGSRAYSQRKKALGETHPHTLNSLHNLAFYYKSAKRHSLALIIFENLYKLQASANGAEHPRAMEAKEQIDKLRALLEGNT